jgi:hypothetical protein
MRTILLLSLMTLTALTLGCNAGMGDPALDGATRADGTTLADGAMPADGGGITGDGPATSGTCVVTLSGALTGSYPCVATGSFKASDNESAVNINVPPGASNGLTIASAFGHFPGELSAQTYTSGDLNAHGAVSATEATIGYLAGVGGSVPAQGSYTLVLTSVAAGSTDPNGDKAYSLHGTLDATMPPLPHTASMGTVTLHATF